MRCVAYNSLTIKFQLRRNLFMKTLQVKFHRFYETEPEKRFSIMMSLRVKPMEFIPRKQFHAL